MTTIDKQAFLGRFPKLATSAGDELDALVDAFDVCDAQAGEALVAEGARSSALFLVWDGELEVRMRKRGLASLSTGSFFGEASLLDPGPASASAVTEQGCVALRLSQDRFHELCRSHPRAAAALLGPILYSLSTRARAAAGIEGWRS